MTSTTLTVQHAVGLHARPASRFVKLAKSFVSTIRVRNITRAGEEVDAKSLVKVIKIAAAQNHEIAVTADGGDEEAAIAAIEAFIREVPEEER